MNKPDINSLTSNISIGQKVRIPIIQSINTQSSNHKKSSNATRNGKGRAMVAFIDKDDHTISIMWDESTFIPQSITQNNPFHVTLKGTKLLNRQFLISPNNLNITNQSILEEEITIRMDSNSMTPLLSFENQEIKECYINNKEDLLSHAKKYKEEGDTLFKLHDYAASIERYEAALTLTSTLSIGGTVFIERNKGTSKAKIVMAEVDCIDDDDIDVTMQDDECVIKEMDVILCYFDTNDALQERMLLNLSKSLLNLGDIISTFDNLASQDFSKAVISACSIILAVSSENDKDTNNAIITSKALYIRAKAYLNLLKFQKATIDTKQILKQKPKDKDALNLLKDIQNQIKESKKTNKRLAKEVCQWVDQATKNTVSDDEDEVPSDKDAKMGSNYFVGSFLILFIALVIMKLSYFMNESE